MIHRRRPRPPKRRIFDQAWIDAQAEMVEDTLVNRWGSGWDLLSDEMRDAFRASEVLWLLLAQNSDKYLRAQRFVDTILESLQALANVRGRK